MLSQTTTLLFPADAAGFEFVGAGASGCDFTGGLHITPLAGTTARKLTFTLADFGLPVGSFLHYADVTVVYQRTQTGQASSGTVGFAAHGVALPALTDDGASHSYDGVGRICYPAGLDSTSAAGVAIAFVSIPDATDYFVTSFTVKIWYDTRDFDSCADMAISPHTVTLAVGASQPFTTNLTADFSINEGAPGGSITPASGAATDYTAPATPGTYHLFAQDPWLDWNSDTATITVVEGAPVLSVDQWLLTSGGAPTADERTWLWNAGAGRTGAEITAYCAEH